jgi:hypothetical protein
MTVLLPAAPQQHRHTPEEWDGNMPIESENGCGESTAASGATTPIAQYALEAHTSAPGSMERQKTDLDRGRAEQGRFIPLCRCWYCRNGWNVPLKGWN